MSADLQRATWVGLGTALTLLVCVICAAVLVYGIIVLAVVLEGRRSVRRARTAPTLAETERGEALIGLNWPRDRFPRDAVRNVEREIDVPMWGEW